MKRHSAKHKLISAEYLEELIVRRELAFNYARFVDRPGRLENLPEWCQKTMAKHAGDKRDPSYTPKQLEHGETYDELWNATQKEMLLRGKIHGYYRMYWGKKMIEWTPHYQDAVDIMIDLHGRYALDGRDPETYTKFCGVSAFMTGHGASGPSSGSLRYMSLEGMKRKTDTKAYMDEIRYVEATGKEPRKVA